VITTFVFRSHVRRHVRKGSFSTESVYSGDVGLAPESDRILRNYVLAVVPITDWVQLRDTVPAGLPLTCCEQLSIRTLMLRIDLLDRILALSQITSVNVST
jgi:hypothetical protein